MLALIAAGVAVSTSDFSLDVFLVANNPSRIANLSWLNVKQTEGVEALLQPVLLEYAQTKTPYMIIDGGDCSLGVGPEKRSPTILKKSYRSFDSATQTVADQKASKTEVLATTTIDSTMISSPLLRPWSERAGYVGKTFVHLDTSKGQVFAILDLNSYRNCLNASQEQDRMGIDSPICLAVESADETRAILRNKLPQFNGICISTWGRPTADAPNVISFPPAGTAIQYRFFNRNGTLEADLVRFLRP
jgi:hypothetical protein